MNIKDVKGCPKCTSEDIDLEYMGGEHESIKVSCLDCGYFFHAACADAHYDYGGLSVDSSRTPTQPKAGTREI